MIEKNKPDISILTMTVRPEGLKPVRDSILSQTFASSRVEWLVDINVTGKVDFNEATNRLIRRASGDLIVFVQDYVEMPENGLQRLWEAYQDKPAFYTVPVAKYDDDSITWDWRANKDGVVNWQDWEIDCGSAPRAALVDVGGFDEELDKYWGYDNLSVGLRADLKGYEVRCLSDVKCRAYDHNKHQKHEFRHLQNVDFSNQRLEYIRQGIIAVNYIV